MVAKTPLASIKKTSNATTTLKDSELSGGRNAAKTLA
jgi:hypothetical protein